MWNSNIKVDYITVMIQDAIAEFSIRGKEDVFNVVIMELKKHFKNCNDEEILEILALCINMYSYQKQEKMELVITAPDSFKIKTKKTHDVIGKLISDASKSITLTGYAVSEHFSDMLDTIIKKSQQGVYIRIYINDIEKQKEVLNRLLAYQSRFLRVFEYKNNNDDKMAALHAKLLIVDSKKALVTSANLSYHGMQGNVEMGILLESEEKARSIESLMKELCKMKIFKQIKTVY